MFESLDTLILEELLVCGSYIESKITKKKKNLFTNKGYKAKKCLELVLIDMHRPFCIHT